MRKAGYVSFVAARYPFATTTPHGGKSTAADIAPQPLERRADRDTWYGTPRVLPAASLTLQKVRDASIIFDEMFDGGTRTLPHPRTPVSAGFRPRPALGGVR